MYKYLIIKISKITRKKGKTCCQKRANKYRQTVPLGFEIGQWNQWIPSRRAFPSQDTLPTHRPLRTESVSESFQCFDQYREMQPTYSPLAQWQRHSLIQLIRQAPPIPVAFYDSDYTSSSRSWQTPFCLEKVSRQTVLCHWC